MNSIEELVAHIKAEGHLPEHDPKVLLEKLKLSYGTFIVNIEKEGHDTKAAFYLMNQSAFHGKELSHEEKVQIGNQMKDVLKTVDLIALTILPGGTVFFILASVLKINKYIIPSAFLKKPE
jgi:hypothetical protein